MQRSKKVSCACVLMKDKRPNNGSAAWRDQNLAIYLNEAYVPFDFDFLLFFFVPITLLL
jgi:hypothetical protein